MLYLILAYNFKKPIKALLKNQAKIQALHPNPTINSRRQTLCDTLIYEGPISKSRVRSRQSCHASQFSAYFHSRANEVGACNFLQSLLAAYLRPQFGAEPCVCQGPDIGKRGFVSDVSRNYF